ncbi:MAG TPA: hypothetical protein VFE58_12175 [Tepidisphaeraceae bacterium]|jgi:hypothetical protein|nr:hypothetical protein [Tepidisphaeraceae bacterium]
MQHPTIDAPWIFLDNLRPFVSFIAHRAGYNLHSDESLAIEMGVRSSNAEAEHWYDYEILGKQRVKLRLATDSGSNVLWWRADCAPPLLEAIDVAAAIMQNYRLSKSVA